MTGPTVGYDLELGTYAPEVEPDWAPLTYSVKAHHRTELSASGTDVVKRTLEGLTLELLDEEEGTGSDAHTLYLRLPADAEGLEAIIAILTHARDYAAQEATA